MERSCDSSPQSRTTTQEQLTTLRALPSRSRTPGWKGLLVNDFKGRGGGKKASEQDA